LLLRLFLLMALLVLLPLVVGLLEFVLLQFERPFLQSQVVGRPFQPPLLRHS
jgi:hypothetical protein